MKIDNWESNVISALEYSRFKKIATALITMYLSKQEMIKKKLKIMTKYSVPAL